MQDQKSGHSREPDWLSEKLATPWDPAKKLHDQKADTPARWDPEMEEKLEDEWFKMGDQQSWIEVRPHLRPDWESPPKS
jgi:hypothetical protein